MPDNSVTIYHNPRCSKSRKTLALLQENGIEPDIVEYLKTPPDKATLKMLVRKLSLRPESLVRKGEDTFKQHYAGKTLTDDQWFEALEKFPILIERPIVVKGERAVLGRPPENVLELL
ncbi:MAG: arsenate reductase (glutaredoxin) [Burkholderiales bacterium]|jgi:arsenate reductase